MGLLLNVLRVLVQDSMEYYLIYLIPEQVGKYVIKLLDRKVFYPVYQTNFFDCNTYGNSALKVHAQKLPISFYEFVKYEENFKLKTDLFTISSENTIKI